MVTNADRKAGWVAGLAVASGAVVIVAALVALTVSLLSVMTMSL